MNISIRLIKHVLEFLMAIKIRETSAIRHLTLCFPLAMLLSPTLPLIQLKINFLIF